MDMKSWSTSEMSCHVILALDERGQPIRCEEDPFPGQEALHVHLWGRHRVTGAFLGDYHYFGPYRDAAEKAAHEKKLADRAALDASRHPDLEWVPMSAETFNRPPDPPKTPEQVAQEKKQARLAELRAKDWSALSLLEQREATDLAFALGEPVPPVTAV
jgi:hypothetical protein